MSSDKYEKFAVWHSSNRPYFLAAVAAIILFMLVAPMTEKGDSMSPTVEKGDVVILQKKTFSEKRGLPEYGEILVFKTDFYEGNVKGAHRLGRVMGLPGDIMEVKDGNVYRNGKKINSGPYTKGKTVGSVEAQKVGTNKVFILCDNRSESVDSRNEKVRALKLDGVRGRAILTIWPLGNFGVIK